MKQELPEKETKPSVALPVVQIDHAYVGPAEKKLAPCPNPSARQALILDYLLGYPSADVPEEVRAKIGNHDWKTPGIKAMANALGMSTGCIEDNLLWLRQNGIVEGYRVEFIGPGHAHYRIVDYMEAWHFINAHDKKVKKLKADSEH